MASLLIRAFSLTALLILFFIKPLDAQVRNIEFGMSPEEVIEAEELTDFIDQDSDGIYIILNEGSVGGLDAFIGYVFAQDMLVRLNYGFNENYSNENNHISDFNDVDEILAGIYGEPDESDVTWLDDLYQDDRSEWGFAISLGHLVYMSEWEMNGMSVIHLLNGDSYDITHRVQYTSAEYGHLEDQVREQQNRSDF